LWISVIIVDINNLNSRYQQLSISLIRIADISNSPRWLVLDWRQRCSFFPPWTPTQFD